MTGRERFLKVFNGQKPDRVPVTIFIVDQGHFLSQCYPQTDPFDFNQLQLQQIELQRSMGCDLMVRLLFDVNDPLHTVLGGVDVTNQTESWRVESRQFEKGDTVVTHSRIITPDGVLEQEMSVNEIRKGTFMYGCTQKPIKCEQDLDIAIKYEPKMREENIDAVKAKIDTVKNAVGDDGIVGVWAPPPPFNNASGLVNHEELYALFLTDFDYYDKLMKFCIGRARDYTSALLAAKPDVLHIGGNAAGGFMGKNMYEQYVLPYEREYIEFCQHTGIPAMYHNCGEVMNLVESYKKLGVRIVEPFSPKPLGDASLEKVCEIVGKDYVVVGSVDQVNVIQKGTLELIRETTKRAVEIGKNSSANFIIQCSDFLEYDTPIENVRAFIETAKEYGAY